MDNMRKQKNDIGKKVSEMKKKDKKADISGL